MQSVTFQKRWILTFIFLAVVCLVQAQQWNPGHKIGTVTGVDHFAPGQTPDQLVEILPAAIPNTGLTYQWYSSTYPTTGFTPISGATGSSYSLPAVQFTQTTYLKRITFNTGLGQLESNVVKLSMVSVDWEDINYMREHEIQVTGVTTWQAADQLAIGSKLQTTSYMDGLGRGTQAVSKGTATPATVGGAWGDVTRFAQYDAYGRTDKTYLAYTTTSQPGKFKSNAVAEQSAYYTTAYGESFPHATSTFDNSPLNRPVNIKKPGTYSHGGQGISAEYDLNIAGDDVQIFTIGYTQGAVPARTGTYQPYTLHKSVSIDEDNKRTIEYIDQKGRTVLTKVQLDDVPADAYNGWICTYRVYDDFGLLRCEIQPEGVKYLAANGWSFSGTNGSTVFAEQCFQYYYDAKGRTIWKKGPGALPTTMLYDNRDRVVFMQDGNQSQLSTPQWVASVYDESDRLILTTLYNTSQSVASLQSAIAAATPASSLTVANPSNNGGGASITLTASLTPITSTDLNNTSVCTVLSYLFYDNYSFSGARTFNTNYNNLTAYSTSDPNVLPLTASSRTNGVQVGQRVRVLGTNDFLSSTQFVNERNQIIQVLEDNIKTGVDITTTQYHFDGRVLSSCTDHTATGGGYTNFKILTKYNFDILGRTVSVQKQIGSNTFRTTASYEYDDLGRVKNKRLDPGYTAGGNSDLESLGLSYNILGQLTGVNKDYALKTPGKYNKWEHFFGMYLGYDNKDNVFNSANKSGRVSGQLWSTLGDDAQRRYDYTYDNAGRLINAAFSEKKSPADSWSATTMDFSVNGSSGKIAYDLNGNLLSLLQKGVIPGTSTPETLDNLAFYYASYSNKLDKVIDNMTNISINGQSGDFKDGSNGATTDYVYDNNGALVTDLNKSVKEITGVGTNGIKYNYLGKPEQIKIVGKGTINIVYSADGEKLLRSFTPEVTGAVITTSYIQEFIYQESSAGGGLNLQFINFEDGRIRVITPVSQVNGTLDALSLGGDLDLPNGKKGAMDFYVMDYLQNVRMLLTEQTYVAKNTCTMETAGGRNTLEEAIFGQAGANNEVSASRLLTPSSWSGNTTAYVSQLGTSSGRNIGPNALQKVMAGDKISASANYFYNTVPGGNNTSFITAVTNSLVQAIGGSASATGLVKQNAAAITGQLSALPQFGSAVQPGGSNPGGTTPQAFLTILFFDERFNFIEASDGGVHQRQVESTVTAAGKPLSISPVRAPKNGYVFVYVSNQSNNAVYFDDFMVTVSGGNILEENHYYPHGLRIAAISSRRASTSAEGYTRNNYLYQGEFSANDEDLNWNEFELRSYDPQISRWLQQDPVDIAFQSPYLGMAADPINFIDPTGGIYVPPVASVAETTGSMIMLSEVIVTSTRHAASVMSLSGKTLSVASVLTKIVTVSAFLNTSIATTQVGGGLDEVYYRGYWNAVINANFLGATDLFGATDNLGEYSNLYDQQSYLRGRIAGDASVMAAALVQTGIGIKGGGALALETGGTSVIVGAGLVAHAGAKGIRAGWDMAACREKLLQVEAAIAARAVISCSPKNPGKAPGNGNSSSSPTNGETNATAMGKEAHRLYTPGWGYTTNRSVNTLKSGRIPDAINLRYKIVRELKPNNYRAIRNGLIQATRYAKELQKKYGGKWKIVIDTYTYDARGNIYYKFNKTHFPKK